MIIGRPIAMLLNILAGILGIATIILMLVKYINMALPINFLPADILAQIDSIIMYTTWGTLFCCGLSFTLKRNVIFAVVFLVIIIATLALMIYCDVIDLDLIKNAIPDAAALLA